VAGAAIRAKGGEKDVRGREHEGVGAGPMPIRDDQHGPSGASDVGVELLRVEHRAVDGSIATRSAPSAIAAWAPGGRGLGVPFVALLQEDLVAEPACLALDGWVGGDDE